MASLRRAAGTVSALPTLDQHLDFVLGTPLKGQGRGPVTHRTGRGDLAGLLPWLLRLRFKHRLLREVPPPFGRRLPCQPVILVTLGVTSPEVRLSG